jgi:hypothetical protein
MGNVACASDPKEADCALIDRHQIGDKATIPSSSCSCPAEHSRAQSSREEHSTAQHSTGGEAIPSSSACSIPSCPCHPRSHRWGPSFVSLHRVVRRINDSPPSCPRPSTVPLPPPLPPSAPTESQSIAEAAKLHESRMTTTLLSAREMVALNELLSWFIDEVGFAPSVAEGYVHLLFVKNIFNVDRLEKKLERKRDLLSDWGVDPDDADAIIVQVLYVYRGPQ